MAQQGSPQEDPGQYTALREELSDRDSENEEGGTARKRKRRIALACMVGTRCQT
jgi:hypothetical protein